MRRAVLLCLFCAVRLSSAFVGDTIIIQFPMHDQVDEDVERTVPTFSNEWDALGPFKIGTRGIHEWSRS
jgi:hypothetical protein